MEKPYSEDKHDKRNTNTRRNQGMAIKTSLRGVRVCRAV